ncbi:isocitrate lyase/phosphoenolpyruvate mutase family protein [Nocardia sp. CDC159]|uniref:Isocitrate lyase/phosphoenolpyruvate mutase family protein n=1 Tax=Nocardia pulmonis TaxID=2951408 RepID=A0A9X2EF72_9NOCA|nr:MULTISPECIES: isocitrate lyase/phosphoenolpyruvate mutase family protein [Nocardia]MCM6778350.1 isocitrate lyase/phosphoenolpyruvate mutase family protein [Nocardia pulmonis]MCM6791254.1 isocitrate lyase/phosphoenolpyruvate mutase family protein [Nocardia sp. CDC159]
MTPCELFRDLHHGDRPLVLPNAWDFTSAAALAAAGFPAVATTSLGVSAAAGLPDAAGLAREDTLQLARRLVRLPVPITVDIEAGFSDDPADIVDLAVTLSAMGVAGINLEDGRSGPALADPAHQADLIAAIKTHAPTLFVNARTDTHWLGIDRDTTLTRARQYENAGADGIFIPGLRDRDEIRTLAAALTRPLNVLVLPDGPTVPDLATLGVRRISTGGLLFRAAVAATVEAARTIRDGRPLPPNLPSYTDIQSLVTR